MSYKAGYYGSAELRRIRGNAPRHDQAQAAFQTIRARPVTLDTLDATCGPYALAAKAEAQWIAITSWLMGSPELPNSIDLTGSVVELVREADKARLGFPVPLGKTHTRPALHDLSPEIQRETNVVAAETVEAWNRAQRPCLSAAIIGRVSHIVHSITNQKLEG